MIDTVLEQGDALRPGAAKKIIRDLIHELYEGHPAASLRPLLRSKSARARAVATHVAFMSGPYSKDILEDVRVLIPDEDPEVRVWAAEVIRQAISAGWILAN
jgi:hypothetical protein